MHYIRLPPDVMKHNNFKRQARELYSHGKEGGGKEPKLLGEQTGILYVL